MTVAAPHPGTTVRPALPGPAAGPGSVDRRTRLRRRICLAATLGGAGVRSALTPARAVRLKQRQQVCRAARILTALGVRVQVVRPPAPWPRGARFVVSDHVSWLGDLALLTAVPGIPLAPTVAGAVPCPVVIRYRRGDRYLPEEEVPGTLDEVLRSRDLVIEVRLLSVPVGWRDPAPAGADRVR